MLPPSKGQTPLYTSMFVLGPSFSHMQKKVSGFHGLTSYDSVTFSFFLFFFQGWGGWLIIICEGNSKDVLSNGSNSQEQMLPVPECHPHKEHCLDNSTPGKYMLQGVG